MKKKDNMIITFIKGFIIGLGVIFPVSASVLAIVMGLYKKLLNIINNFFKCFKKEYKFIISLFLGIAVSCVVSCLALDFTLEKFPIATLLFFIGLIVGGMPLLFKKTNKEYKFSNWIFLVLGILVLVGISLLSGSKEAVLSTSAGALAKLFLVGVIGAGSMLVPGVSGSVMLVILGYYEPLLAIISETVKFQNLANNILIIGIFGIGMLVGIILVSKIMEYFLDKHEIKTYFAINGFVLASVVNVGVSLFSYTFNVIEFIIGLALFAVGFMISFKYLKEE